jgi:hypothetical protein
MISSTNNLVIVFFPGAGGHHLANLLSITGRYQYIVDYSRYFVGGADSKHAHYQDDSADNSIYLCHYGSADDSHIEKISGPNTQFLVIHFPINNKLAWRRIEIYNKIKLRNFHFRHDLEKMYKPQHLEKLYPGKWSTVMADDLFSDNTDLLFDKLENYLGIQFVDRELGSSLHLQWIKNISVCLGT